jgi:hypothetical protein
MALLKVIIIYWMHLSNTVVVTNLFSVTVHVMIIRVDFKVLLFDVAFILQRLTSSLSRRIKTLLHRAVFHGDLSGFDATGLVVAILVMIAQIVIMSLFIDGICLMWHHVRLLGLVKVIITILSSMLIQDLSSPLFATKPKAEGLYSIWV